MTERSTVQDSSVRGIKYRGIKRYRVTFINAFVGLPTQILLNHNLAIKYNLPGSEQTSYLEAGNAYAFVHKLLMSINAWIAGYKIEKIHHTYKILVYYVLRYCTRAIYAIYFLRRMLTRVSNLL